MDSPLNVAVADRQLTFADSVARRLHAQGVAVATAHTSLDALLSDLAQNPADVVLLDWSLCPSLDEALRVLREHHPGAGVVVVGDRREPHRIVAAMQSGALGWAPKDISFD